MASPLKLGIAGLGTVGGAVARLLEQQRDVLAARCGRAIEVVAVSARSRGKRRDFDQKKLRWVADPVALEAELDQIAGVVCVGLFARRPADVVLVGEHEMA